MKYRLCGVDTDLQEKQFGHAQTLKDARTMKQQMAQRGIKLFIQNTQNKKIYA